MRVLIAEDDAASRKLLRYFIGGLPDYKIVGEATDGEELIRMAAAEKPDVVLVDINMPLVNGMEAVKACKELFPWLQVIFITGHDEYALEAFDVKAIDYLLKPIERGRLYAALERAAQMLQSRSEKQSSPKKELMIKQQKNMIFIPLNDIVFIERLERKSLIHTTQQIFETYEALSSLEEYLDERFIASHRSYIINIKLLTRIEAAGQMYKAYFRDYDKPARISKNKLEEVQAYKVL